MTPTFYRGLLVRELERRRRKNPKYSLRAFAKSLGVDAARMSRVLSGILPLSFVSAERVAATLFPSGRIRQRFLDSVATEHTARSLAKTPRGRAGAVAHDSAPRELPLARFDDVADWHHFAILELTFVAGFQASAAWISDRLGIGADAAEAALAKLIHLGFLTLEGGTWRKTEARVLARGASLSTPSLRRHQAQMLAKAHAAVENSAVERRAITTIMLPANAKAMSAARQMIEDFAWNLCREMTAGTRDEVYGLCIAFFPLEPAEAKKNLQKTTLKNLSKGVDDGEI